MNTEIDFYAVLGVLPNAEGVVVVAAYRALASLYHPDRWKGAASEANARMSEINVAYGVLGDATKRREYDASRRSSHSTYENEEGDRDTAFDAALAQVEDRWQVAVNIYPDLASIRKRLAKTAHRLAFAFVTVMLETKRFPSRDAVAEAMERTFLERYFGTSEQIILFAKELIQLGLKDAVVALNKYVDVLGSDVEPSPLIDRVQTDYRVGDARKAFAALEAEELRRSRASPEIRTLKASLQKFRNEVDARDLLTLCGYEVSCPRLTQPPSPLYVVRLNGGARTIVEFFTVNEFVEWTVQTICNE